MIVLKSCFEKVGKICLKVIYFQKCIADKYACFKVITYNNDLLVRNILEY